MDLPVYVVDAFSSVAFKGNSAAVCPLEGPLESHLMQAIAMEMNHAETAFTYPVEGGYNLRWFTPTVEVDLCGHATLAAAHVLYKGEPLNFHTRSGILTVDKRDGEYVMDFPAEPAEPTPLSGPLTGLDGIVFTGHNRMDWIIEVESAQQVRDFQPDFQEILALGKRGVIVTAQAEAFQVSDFVSRFFCPSVGVQEDPVTGSAHCCLGPYWAARLDKESVLGYQASDRGGYVGVNIKENNRVELVGSAVTTLVGHLKL